MISYLSCNEGKLELHNYEDDGSNEIVCSSNHVNELANCLANYGFGEYFRTSSSMDFADEYGFKTCLLYTSPSPRDEKVSRMPSSA